MAETDSPWKEALEKFFEAFLALLFPKVHAGIDWKRRVTFLDKELEQVLGGDPGGRRIVDKLARVTRLDGSKADVIVHIEVQARAEAAFAHRMFKYFARLHDKHDDVPVVSLAVLADPGSAWRPDEYEYNLWDCDLRFRFPTVKLADYRTRLDELARNENPFAIILLAHLTTQATRRALRRRKHRKIELTEEIGRRGYRRRDAYELYRVMDWLMPLPSDLAQEFDEAREALMREGKVPFITSVERRAIQRGMIQKAREAVLEVLEARFGSPPPEVVETVQALEDAERLNDLLRQAATVASLPAFQGVIDGSGNTSELNGRR